MAKIQINKKGSSKQHTCEFGKRKCDQAIEWSRAAKAFADFSYLMGFMGFMFTWAIPETKIRHEIFRTK